MGSRTQFKVLIKIADQVQSFIVDKKSFTIGRSKKADLQISYDYLSNLHLRFDEVSEKNYIITDLGSTNGTYLKNQKIISNKNYHYSPGEEILIKAQGGIRLKIIPFELQESQSVISSKLEIELENKKLIKIKDEIELRKNELVKLSQLAKMNRETYWIEKENCQLEMQKISVCHQDEISQLKNQIETLNLEKMDENLKVMLIKEELTILSKEKSELREVVESQYRAYKVITQKTDEISEMLKASESSLTMVLKNLNDKTLEYENVDSSLVKLKNEYEKLKHKSDLLDAETKKLIELYVNEKEQFDLEMESKRKRYMEETNKQIEEFNDELLKKKNELDNLKTEFEIRQTTYTESLKKYEQREKEKTEIELKRQIAQAASEALFYKTELKEIENIYKKKIEEQNRQLLVDKNIQLAEIVREIDLAKQRSFEQISIEAKNIADIKKEKEESLESLRLLHLELNKQQDILKDFLEEMKRQQNEVISQAESETDKELRTMKFRKVQEIAEQVGNLVCKSLLQRMGSEIDDDYIKKSGFIIRKLIVEKMMESNEVDTERTRQLIIGDEFKKIRKSSSTKNEWSSSSVAGVAVALFIWTNHEKRLHVD